MHPSLRDDRPDIQGGRVVAITGRPDDEIGRVHAAADLEPGGARVSRGLVEIASHFHYTGLAGADVAVDPEVARELDARAVGFERRVRLEIAGDEEMRARDREGPSARQKDASPESRVGGRRDEQSVGAERCAAARPPGCRRPDVNRRSRARTSCRRARCRCTSTARTRTADAFEGRSSHRSWLFAIALRVAREHRRSASRLELDDTSSAASNAARPDDAEARRIVAEGCAADLPARGRPHTVEVSLAPSFEPLGRAGCRSVSVCAQGRFQNSRNSPCRLLPFC